MFFLSTVCISKSILYFCPWRTCILLLLIVCIKSSVKINRGNNIIDDNSNEKGNSSSDGLDIEPKNSVVK